MTQTKSFLPDNKPVYCHVLAHLPYLREMLEKITEGSNPADFLPAENAVPLWGLLYIGDGGIGFFVHPSEAPMALLFRGKTDGVPPGPVHLFIPYEQITSAQIIHPRLPRTIPGKLWALISCKKEDMFLLTWKPEQNGKPVDSFYQLRFFVTTDSADFERELETRTANR